MQDKHKKNLYKILFIAILLSFTISLVGCSWFSFGIFNIFDPQAQIRVNYTDINLETEPFTINLEIYSINEVEFIGTGFEYEYYVGTTKINSLTKICFRLFSISIA